LSHTLPTLSAAPTRPRRAPVIPTPSTRPQRILAWLAARLIRLLARTLRYRIHSPPGPATYLSQPVIFALWHNRLCLCMRVYEHFVRPQHHHRHLAALVSASKDGALLASILQDSGVQPVRGSSSRRGGQAILELASWAARGHHLAITPDGPRGPCYTVHDGIITLAQLTGLPIVPYSCQLRWKLRLKSWDRFQIPLPFSPCQMTFGTPIRVPTHATEADRALLRDHLRTILLAGSAGE